MLLARALTSAQKMIVLDEPAAGLDTASTAEMYKVIKEINDDDITILMVSHDVETALEYASHILHIGREGCFFGRSDEYRDLRMEGK